MKSTHSLRKMVMKTIVVLPAYNCSKTIKQTVYEIPSDIVDDIILVDDCSQDTTCLLAEELGITHIYKHQCNLGYGANQKSCYDKALSLGADIIVMLHPDYQYDPKLISKIVHEIELGEKIVFASRLMHGFEAVKNGIPIYKYIANRFLTIFQNILLHKSLSEYHTGYRAYTRDVLLDVSYNDFSDDFIFDNQFILAAFSNGYSIKELYCPARYEKDSSSIKMFRSIRYGFGVVYYTLKYKMKNK